MTTLEIDVIDSLERFDELRSDWECAYGADPSAQHFNSWRWLRAWFEIAPNSWFVLAVRSPKDGRYVAFLPLAVGCKRVRGFTAVRELRLGGKPMAPYTGFVCVPEYEEAALEDLARFLRESNRWDVLRLEEVIDSRFEQFVGHFRTRGFAVKIGDELSCPLVSLPNTWDEYLTQYMTSKARFNLRRSFRQVEKLPGFRCTSPDAGSIRPEIDTLLQLWQARWGDASDEETAAYRHLYMRAFEQDSLWLKTLWDGPKPIASTAAYVDRDKASVLIFTVGFDADFGRLSPGKLIVGYAIRDAIENGAKVFDFLVGGHDYKLSFFGASQRFAKRAEIMRQSLRRSMGELLLKSRNLVNATLRSE